MMWSAFVINFARAIQDIATDALCVYLLPKAKRAAMQWSSSLVSDVGAVIGGAGFIALIAVFGWVELILVLTLVVLCLGLIWPWRLIKSKRVLLDDESKMAPAWGKEVMTLFRWGPAMAVLLALTAHVCDGGFSPLVWTWMGKNLGYSANGMWMLVLFSSLFKPVGSALAGFLVEKTQRKAAIGVSLLGKAFSYVVLGGLVSYWGSQVLVYLLVMFTAIFEAATVSTMRAYFIDLTKRSAAATQFSVYMAATNGSAAIAGLLGGVVGELFSMDQALVFLGLLQLIALIPLVALYFLEAKE